MGHSLSVKIRWRALFKNNSCSYFSLVRGCFCLCALIWRRCDGGLVLGTECVSPVRTEKLHVQQKGPVAVSLQIKPCLPSAPRRLLPLYVCWSLQPRARCCCTDEWHLLRQVLDRLTREDDVNNISCCLKGNVAYFILKLRANWKKLDHWKMFLMFYSESVSGVI